MLSGWARLKNGPLVPEAVTKVTSLGVSNGTPPSSGSGIQTGLKEHEPRRTRSFTKATILSWIFFVELRVLRGSCICGKPLLAMDSRPLSSTIVQTLAPFSVTAS
jgi:hypothetical protein